MHDPSRPKDDRDFDARRKPALVLAYAGIRPGEIVGEYLPGGGYYTRLLSDIVGPGGKVYALETTTWGQKNIDATKQVLSNPGRSNVVLDLAPLGTFHAAKSSTYSGPRTIITTSTCRNTRMSTSLRSTSWCSIR